MPDATPVDPFRLPRTVIPSRYQLTLRPDLDAATFSGSVHVALTVQEATDTVVLNAIELEIDEAVVVVGDTRHPARIELEEATERLHLHLDDVLPPGEAALDLAFRGILNDQLRGFYRSTFTDEKGEERVLATTQFEATDARRAFPCWDEPDLKATFAVTLDVPADLLAVANTREVARQELEDGAVRIHFAESMVMSTYLVAFVIGPLEVTDPVPAGGVDLRVVHPMGKGDLARYALEVGAFCLDHLADWYDIAYPGDKMDLVAVPDFAFGAMENLGCVTFREVLLLVDPATATQPDLQNVVDVIAHELAHMWFGDLVTMRWWNGIWLNEAFATFMEMATTDAFRPDWERWVGFGVSRSEALDTDALHTTRPIEFEVTSPDDAEGMFDVLTYEKGAAVVRMLEQYLGEERFRDGIRRYLDTHQYANTETTDLWDAIEAATGEPTRRIMDTWIFRAATRWWAPPATATAWCSPRSGSPTCRAPRPPAGPCRSSSPGAPTVGRAAPSGCCSTATTPTSSWPGAPTGSWSTRAGPASTGWPTPPPCGPRWPSGPTPSWNPSSATSSSMTWPRPPSPAGCPPPTCSTPS